MTSGAGAAPVWGAVIVAAGRGERFGARDKLLALVEGRPVIVWSVEALLTTGRFQDAVVVTGSQNRSAIEATLAERHSTLDVRYCTGGETRSESVRCGLAALNASVTHVAVHDGARPLVPASLVSDVLDAAELSGAAVPGIQPVASIGIVSNDRRALAGPVDRARLLELQTPQAARVSLLVDALERFPDETDESTALLKAGYDVSLITGARSNLKITVPDDITVARALASSRVMS